MMRLEFDPDKRAKTLLLRGLDFARSTEVFAGPHYTAPDERREYAEARWLTAGMLDGRLVVLVWTRRGDARRIISLRKANGREKALYAPHLGRS